MLPITYSPYVRDLVLRVAGGIESPKECMSNAPRVDQAFQGCQKVLLLLLSAPFASLID